MANFDKAVAKVLEHEGGYVNDPVDAGGETKYGITKRTYPTLDIKNLTINEAKVIYYRDFWLKENIDKIEHDELAQKVFDTGVNMGASRAIKFLQEAANKLGAKLVVDGGLGPKTLEIVNRLEGQKLLTVFRELQAAYYQDIVKRKPEQAKFLKGWLKRAAS